MTPQVTRAAPEDTEAVAYLERDLVRNALDIWGLRHEGDRYELHLCRLDSSVAAHLSIFRAEADYVALGGDEVAAEELLHLVPTKAVVTIPPHLRRLIVDRLRADAIFTNDIMVVKRGEEALGNTLRVQRIGVEHAMEYSKFGSSFNAQVSPPHVSPLEWIQDRLGKNMAYDAFCDGELVSVASLVAWLPQVAVIMGVETRQGFRKRGFGNSVVSAALMEALRRSESCTLFVRSDNEEAISLYRKLGFRKFADELFIDIGTGIVP